MINTLKKKSTQKHFDKLLAKSNRNVVITKNINSVGVLIEEKEYNSITILEELKNVFQVNESLVEFVVYKEGNVKEELPEFYITSKEFGWSGSLKSNFLERFVKKEFDVLINYTSISNLPLNLLTLLSKAKFKVGFANIDDRLFDFVVADKNFRRKTLHEELKKYRQILNT